MRRTLTIVLATAALLAPAAAASAAPPSGVDHPNASCSNGKGGNGATYNGNGNMAKAESGPTGFACVGAKGHGQGSNNGGDTGGDTGGGTTPELPGDGGGGVAG